MADVDTWAAVDDDNDLAPPDGWPEGQMPSSVNNCGRAMMGAIRRMYDKIVAGTLALPYLPLAGGTVTGNVAVNGTGGVALSSTQLRNISGGLEVYNATGGSITTRGPGASYIFGNRDQVSPSWYLYAAGGAAFLDNGSTGIVLSMSNAGDLAISGSINTIKYEITDTLFAERSGDNAHLIYDADGQLALALYGAAAGNVNYYRADTHAFQNNAGAGIFAVNSAGGIIATGGANITGNITGVTNITASGAVTSADAQFTYCNVTIAIDCIGNIDAASYSLNGGPMPYLTAADFAVLEARIAVLEARIPSGKGK